MTLPISRTSATHAAIDLSTVGDVATIVVLGELDASNADALERACALALRSGTRAIDVDLGSVAFIDSTAVTALVAVWRQALECRVALTITEASRQVRRLVTMVGLEGMGPFPATWSDGHVA